jgi:anti-anti-sigma regulatory factor
MEIEVTRANGKLSLAFIGECGIEEAGMMKNSILDALNSSSNVVLDLERTTAADLCLYQLICSAHRFSLESGKLFCLASTLPEVFTRTARRSGYVRAIGCHKDPLKNCVWLEVQDE